MTSTANIPGLQEQLSQLFGSYKAEWLKEQIFELFTEPAYFPELKTTRSCVLIGGRGTGKTTVLRGLSYQGQFALCRNDPASVFSWKQIGVYYRINTNHVTAFSGPELTDRAWGKLFAHYFNLLLCDLVLEFAEWHEFTTNTQLGLTTATCEQIALSLHLPRCADLRDIRSALGQSRIGFEAYINNVVDSPQPALSLQSAPLDLVCKALLQLPQFAGKQFSFMLDEYENLLDYQQRVVNTLVKHASDFYCFKIGVRDLGWRCRTTLNENEQLVHPADYARINIAEKLHGDVFESFALNVCTERIKRLSLPGQDVLRDLRLALPELSEDDEAIALGVEEFTNDLRKEISQSISDSIISLDNFHPLELFFVKIWADSQNMPISEVLGEASVGAAEWKTRYGNYKHALLYTIRKGKRGIRKHYAGWSVLAQLAAGNIRYVLELVDQSFLVQYQERRSISEPILPDAQTKAAQRVAGMNLAELEGLSVDGAQLTKLVLSLGRIFGVLAGDVAGHAPEVNQFYLKSDGQSAPSLGDISDVERILNSAVMHLALIRFPGSKPGDVGDTKDYEYMVHPIFCPMFSFSYRRKRKLSLSPEAILGLIKQPKQTIRSILKTNNRTVPGELPEQLALFERFYDADP